MARLMNTHGFRVNAPSWKKRYIDRQGEYEKHKASWQYAPTWADFSEWLGAKTEKRLIGSNTTIKRESGGNIAIYLFGNKIIEYDAILPITELSNGGYMGTLKTRQNRQRVYTEIVASKTTIQRLGQFSHASFFQRNKVIYIVNGENTIPFTGRVWVDPYGNISEDHETAVNAYFNSLFDDKLNPAYLTNDLDNYGSISVTDLLPEMYDLSRADHFPQDAHEAIYETCDQFESALRDWLWSKNLNLAVVTRSDMSEDSFTGYGCSVLIVSSETAENWD